MKKKIIVLLIAVVALTAILLSACAGKKAADEGGLNGGVNYDGYSSADIASQGPEKTYYIYVEKGAVVTQFDNHTGEFTYMEKCEVCGWVSSSFYSGMKIPEGSKSYMTTFYCGNMDCSMSNTQQELIISQTVTEG